MVSEKVTGEDNLIRAMSLLQKSKQFTHIQSIKIKHVTLITSPFQKSLLINHWCSIYTWWLKVWQWVERELCGGVAVTGWAWCCNPHEWWCLLFPKRRTPPHSPSGCAYPAPLCICCGHCGIDDALHSIDFFVIKHCFTRFFSGYKLSTYCGLLLLFD